jgi:hypothetical protein
MCSPTLFSGWTEIEPGVMQKDDVGPLGEDRFDGVEPYVGMLVLAWRYGLDDDDKKLTGPYIVDDVGGHLEDVGLPTQHWVDTKAVLRRVSDYNVLADFTTGMIFIIGMGNFYGARYVRLTTEGQIVLGTTILDWELLQNWTPTVTYNLLTADQTNLDAADSSTATATLNAMDGGLELDHPLFDTLVGIPNAGSFPAGKLQIDLDCKVSSAETGETRLSCWFGKKSQGGVYTPFWIIWTSPITTTDFAVKTISVPVEAQTLAPTDGLFLKLRASTTSLTDVTVTVLNNGPLRLSRINTTLEFPVQGTRNHQDLTNRFMDVASGEDPCHPLHALGDGRLLLCADDATVEDGVITMPANANTGIISATGTFKGIKTTRWKKGSIVLLVFTGGSSGSPVILQHGATVGENEAPFFHYCSGPSAGGSLTFKAQPARVWFVYDQINGRWLLVGGPYL